MHTKTALITGATSGFGIHIAEHLVKKGYRLIILGRSEERMATLSNHLKMVDPASDCKFVPCDLSSFESMSKACAEVRSCTEVLNLLILNAGLWNFQFSETSDKIEETFQVNLLAPVFLFKQLSDLLPSDGHTKVVFTGSGLHQGTICFSDIEFRKKFSGFRAYRQSKLGILLITRLLAQQPQYSRYSFFCVHPGMVNTQLGRSAGWFSNFIFQLFGKSPDRGAETHRFLIDQSADKLQTGGYYANCKIGSTTTASRDMQLAKQLFDVINGYLPKESVK
jgi:retinol dehydrogenase 14